MTQQTVPLPLKRGQILWDNKLKEYKVTSHRSSDRESTTTVKSDGGGKYRATYSNQGFGVSVGQICFSNKSDFRQKTLYLSIEAAQKAINENKLSSMRNVLKGVCGTDYHLALSDYAYFSRASLEDQQKMLKELSDIVGPATAFFRKIKEGSNGDSSIQPGQ